MFRQTYESDPLAYRLPWNGSGPYNAYLVTPPRQYAEEIAGMLWCAPMRLDLPGLRGVYYGTLATLEQIYWPSWDVALFLSDAAGAVTRVPVEDGFMFYAWTRTISASWQGVLYRTDVTGAMQPVTMIVTQQADGSLLATYSTGDSVEASHFGVVGISWPIVDQDRDLVVLVDYSQAYINVHTLSTGALIRQINMSGTVASIAAADTGQVYVLCTNDRLNVVDIDAGRIVGTSLCPRTPGATDVVLGWHGQYRRLLLAEETPPASDGASTIRVRGYYPVPIAVDLTKPIPLIPPRVNRSVPVAVRVIGDVGEPIAACVVEGEITETPPAEAELLVASGSPDATGYATLMMQGGVPGSVTFDATAEV